MAMIGNHDHGGMLFGMPENGRMGDYVFNQEGGSTCADHPFSSQDISNIALDQIMTQIMENSNANRPAPASEEIMANLPREVLLENCK